MATLTILHNERFALPMPYVVSINGRNVGIIRLRKFLIDNIPAGKYDVTIKCGVFLKGRELMVSGSMSIDIGEGEAKEVEFSDRDRIWNVLFDIDLVLWVVEFFVVLPSPWHLVYKIVSNGFFIVWLLRMWIIRRRYFMLKVSSVNSF
ncbi:MAG: hypothetical protein MJ002_05945 [Paludibacteraceae bacterium]|nr:hypothetical protein [Paludibacteraceae bacterium]